MASILPGQSHLSWSSLCGEQPTVSADLIIHGSSCELSPKPISVGDPRHLVIRAALRMGLLEVFLLKQAFLCFWRNLLSLSCLSWKA